jgi:hypothetical protein
VPSHGDDGHYERSCSTCEDRIALVEIIGDLIKGLGDRPVITAGLLLRPTRRGLSASPLGRQLEGRD